MKRLLAIASLVALCSGAVALLALEPAPTDRTLRPEPAVPLPAAHSERSDIVEPVICPMVPSLGDWRRARHYLAAQPGRRSLSVITSTGQQLNYKAEDHYRTASLIKAMIAVAVARTYRDRDLPASVQSDLRIMIRVSDNEAASRLYERVGEHRMVALAKAAKMQDFEPAGYWGLHELTARDQARFFHQLNLVLPARHEELVRRHLASITPSQRWGIPKGLPLGYTPLFKGGWREGPGMGIVTHQAARLEFEQKPCHQKVVSIAILSDHNTSWTQGQRVAEQTTRLLLP